MRLRFERWRLAILQAFALIVIAVLTTDPSAQGLGDVAKKEAERRQQAAKGKQYTNADLPALERPAPVAAPPTVSVTPGTDTAAGPSSPSPAEPGAKAGEPSTPPSNPEKDKEKEQYWRNKAQEIRQKLNQLREQGAAMEARVDDLSAQLAKGAGSSHVQERALTEKSLAQVRRDTQYLQDEWNRLEARARALKVQPSWIQ